MLNILKRPWLSTSVFTIVFAADETCSVTFGRTVFTINNDQNLINLIKVVAAPLHAMSIWGHFTSSMVPRESVLQDVMVSQRLPHLLFG